MRGKVLRVLVALSMMTVVVTTASATADQATEILAPLGYVSTVIDNEEGETMEISYEVEVTDGVNVNVFFMDSDGYADLVANRTFEYYDDYSEKDTDGVDKEWVWASKGTFYVVIQNPSVSPGDVSTVEYKVTWQAGPLGFNWLWCVVVIVIIVVLTMALAFMKQPEEEDTDAPPPEEEKGT